MERDCLELVRKMAGILERSAAERNGIYNIIRMAAIHDPFETGPHAERVGAIAAELYHYWGNKQALDQETIRQEKGRIRLAAMLHDIGKVGVSDIILKKEGRLSEAEMAIIRTHTGIGASILADDPGDTAMLACEIALHHHQKWNGLGYTGEMAPILSGEDIPFGARITSLADVFDALVSLRCYKNPWPFEAAFDLLKSEAGHHFDPQLVDCMYSISGLLRPIYDRFPDKQ
jgi:response regulator RpfG family c-di-GMP phosphodiesterase